MGLFSVALSDQQPLRMQLDSAQAATPTTFTCAAFVLEWTAGTSGVSGSYSIPVLTHEAPVIDFRIPYISPEARSGTSALSQCRVSYNIPVSGTPNPLINNTTPYFTRWTAPSLRHAFVASRDGGARLSAQIDPASVAISWTGTLLWEEI